MGGRLWLIAGSFALLILLVSLTNAAWQGWLAGPRGWHAALPALLSGTILLAGLAAAAVALRRLVFRPLQLAARRLEAPPPPHPGDAAPAEAEEEDAPGEIAELMQRLGAARATQDEALRLRDLLLRESHHRLKNHLTLLSSFLRLQERRVEDPAAVDALRAAQGRLMAIAATYDHVHEIGPEEVSLDGMLERLAQALPDREGSGGSVETALCPVSVPADTAVKLALVVNELATNALRHGPAGGRVRITLRRDVATPDQPETLVITVADEGPGVPADLRKGLGMTISDSLVRAVGARLARLEAGEGSGWEIRWSPPAAALGTAGAAPRPN
ncbi:sensor histidine kinase [Roseomonas elaeocarpi]|uniref:histidine kinase n=1 Tax=Roseomonas elaeocarpi TaxID=907779 RepID=A0ABV6JVA5_9PROT